MSQIDDMAQENVASPSRDVESRGPTATAEVSTPRLTQCYQAFLRDLPTLLDQCPGQWAAYAGEKRLSIGPSKRDLYRQCIALGHRDGDFLICGIELPQEVVLDDLPEV
jgi:hypothetical protein